MGGWGGTGGLFTSGAGLGPLVDKLSALPSRLIYRVLVNSEFDTYLGKPDQAVVEEAGRFGVARIVAEGLPIDEELVLVRPGAE